MPAQTADGTHIITVGELLEMLAQCDPHGRIEMESGYIDRVERGNDGTMIIKESPMTATEKRLDFQRRLDEGEE